MAKSAIDGEVNNQIFRSDWPMIIALRRDLAQISPVRITPDLVNDLAAGTCLARVTSTGIFNRWQAVSGGTYDTPCILLFAIKVSDMQDNLSGGTLGRAVMAGFVYKGALTQYDANWKTAADAKEQTDATQVTIVKF